MLRAAIGLAVATAALAAPRVHPLSRIPAAHQDVEVSAVFVGADISALPVGEKLRLVAGFVNNGESPLNITGIMGSLNRPEDFSQYIFNTTGRGVGDVVAAGEEISLAYELVAPEMTDYPASIQLAMTVFYEDDAGQYYATTYYNETVSFVRSGALKFSLQASLSTVLAPLAVVLFIALVTFAVPQLKATVSKLSVVKQAVIAVTSAPEKEVDLDITPRAAKSPRAAKRQ